MQRQSKISIFTTSLVLITASTAQAGVDFTVGFSGPESVQAGELFTVDLWAMAEPQNITLSAMGEEEEGDGFWGSFFGGIAEVVSAVTSPIVEIVRIILPDGVEPIIPAVVTGNNALTSFERALEMPVSLDNPYVFATLEIQTSEDSLGSLGLNYNSA